MLHDFSRGLCEIMNSFEPFRDEFMFFFPKGHPNLYSFLRKARISVHSCDLCGNSFY